MFEQEPTEDSDDDVFRPRSELQFCIYVLSNINFTFPKFFSES